MLQLCAAHAEDYKSALSLPGYSEKHEINAKVVIERSDRSEVYSGGFEGSEEFLVLLLR